MTRFYLLKTFALRVIVLSFLFGPAIFTIMYACRGEWQSFFVSILVGIFLFMVVLISFVGVHGFDNSTQIWMFMPAVLNEINYFRKRGYQLGALLSQDFYYPGVVMAKEGMPTVELYYNYRIFQWGHTVLKIKSGDTVTSYSYDTAPDAKKLAKKFDSIFGLADPNVKDLTDIDLNPFAERRRLQKLRRQRENATQSESVVNNVIFGEGSIFGRGPGAGNPAAVGDEAGNVDKGGDGVDDQRDARD